MGYRELREMMVEKQLAARGISDRRVLEAMRKVPRHEFAGEANSAQAYDDMALQIGRGQTISQPYMVAIMSELLEINGGEKVLEIGTGSGYQTAVLAELGAEVYTVEFIAELSERAKNILESLGYQNIHFLVGDGTLGWPEAAPFGRVLVTAGAPEIPAALAGQLEEGGIIVIPTGSLFSQVLVKGKKEYGKLETEQSIPCVFVPLVGEHGWKEGK